MARQPDFYSGLVAAELYMSVATVTAHASRVLTKLEADNRVQVALLAHGAGLL